MEENFLFYWIHVPSSSVTINSVGSSGLAHFFMAQTDITNDYLATQSHVMTLQKPASVETVWIYLECECVFVPLRSLCLFFASGLKPWVHTLPVSAEAL